MGISTILELINMSLNHYADQFPPQQHIPLYRTHFNKYTLIYTIERNNGTDQYLPLILINNLNIFQQPHYFVTKAHPIIPSYNSLHELINRVSQQLPF